MQTNKTYFCNNIISRPRAPLTVCNPHVDIVSKGVDQGVIFYASCSGSRRQNPGTQFTAALSTP